MKGEKAACKTIDIRKMEEASKRLRADVIKMVHLAGSGHIGASLSILDVLIVLYSSEIRLKKSNGRMVSENKLILSKGHACPALYACLAEKGAIRRDELWRFRKAGSLLQGHPSISIPGVDAQSGSLGQGLSIANGMAMAAKMDKRDMRVFVILGDGELQEGQIWEAARNSVLMGLNNVIAIVDVNGLQTDAPTPEGHDIFSIGIKWKAFGWNVIAVDAHDFESIITGLRKAKSSERPSVILAKSVKGKGVSFMEGNPAWHGKVPSSEELKKALSELLENKNPEIKCA